MFKSLRSRLLCPNVASKIHRLCNDTLDSFRRLGEILVGEVGIARRRPMSLMPEQPADERMDPCVRRGDQARACL